MNVLVTGGSGGIGLETALGIARKLGASVWVTGRNEGRLEEATRALRAAGAAESRAFRADFSSLDAVRRLAAEVSDAAPDGLHVLVNNAGLWHQERQESADGFEDTFAVNHLAPFLLTALLTPRLLEGGRSGRAARVVNVSSRLHERPARLDPSELVGSEPPYVGLDVYARTKLCNVLFSNELARRLDGHGVVSNALHPGSVQTDVVRDSFLLSIGIRIAGPFLKTAAEGALTSIRLATDPALEGVTGGYFSDEAQKPPSPAALDEHAARELWARSLEWTGLEGSALAAQLRAA